MNVLENPKEAQGQRDYFQSVDRDFLLGQDGFAYQNSATITLTRYQVANPRETTPYLPGFRESKPTSDPDRTNRLADYVDVPHDSDQTCNVAVIPASFFENIVDFQSIVESISRTQNATWDQTLPAVIHPDVIKAPKWLRDQRKASRQRPPPSLQKVQTQFKASAEVRRKLDANPNY